MYQNKLLADGPMPVTTLEIEVKGAGISWDTFKSAKDKLGVAAHRDGRFAQDGKTTGRWLWGLPALRADQPKKQP